jgi:hypothetical protein
VSGRNGIPRSDPYDFLTAIILINGAPWRRRGALPRVAQDDGFQGRTPICRFCATQGPANTRRGGIETVGWTSCRRDSGCSRAVRATQRKPAALHLRGALDRFGEQAIIRGRGFHVRRLSTCERSSYIGDEDAVAK